MRAVGISHSKGGVDMGAVQAQADADSQVILDQDATAGLRHSFRGELICPSDPDYDEARRVWNGMIDKRPR